VSFSTGGFGFVIAQNGNKPAGVTTEWFKPVADIAQAKSWPNKDLFPEFGMPSLSPRIVRLALSAEMVAKLAPSKAENQVRRSIVDGFLKTRRQPIRRRPTRPRTVVRVGKGR
jgi:hypothetical protein